MERLLGQGGMGAVYAVVDRTNGHRLALKRLNANARDKASALFEREYRTLAGLRHPCIVSVYDYGTDDDGAYYTMELVEGRDLGTRAPLPWRQACGYLRDTASILGLLHARRLLHRDLSPRNLIETPSGRLKLIDFGALAEFGPPLDVVGTPPFVPPEALRTAPVDQRADLFALGALGYWLVTGANAFPARALSDLPQLWQREPTPASSLVRMIGKDVLEPPPPELDDLLAALLRVDPHERPSTTAELIDRLNTVAELAPEASDDAVAGYLASKAFVGRQRERERFTSALAEARQGTGQVLAIEGDSGVGRSRFLQELAVLARVDGALTLTVDGAGGRRAYAAAENVLAQWFVALPDAARAAASPHAATLAHVSPTVRQRFGMGRLSQLAHTGGEERVRIQNALLEVFTTLARSQLTALLIDDLQALDEESQAVFAALAHGAGASRLCLAATLGREANREFTPAVNSFRGLSSRLRLLPLNAQETRQLLSSVFGEVAYLDRLAERLHRSSEGNPQYCLELAQHLVQTGSARYVEGQWVLPTELAADSLPRSRHAGLLARLERLPPPARKLAQQLSVPHGGSWSREQAAAASGLAPEQTQQLIDLLVREGVLRGDHATGFSTAHEDLRETLYGELDPNERQAVHARVGRELLRQEKVAGLEPQLRACAHFVRAQEIAQAHVALKRALNHYPEGDVTWLASAAADVEEVYLLLRDAGSDRHTLAAPLGLLAISGYFANRRYAERYGELALATLQQVLRMSLLHKLSPWLGRKLALLVTLAIAGIGLRLRGRRSMPVQYMVRMLLSAASALSGVAATCLDPDRADRYARVIEPFTALGDDHVASLVHDFSKLMAIGVRDRPARSVRAMRAMIARLESGQPIRQLPEPLRLAYLAGSHVPLGVTEGWRDSVDVLAIADRLEQFSPLYAMSAEHIRGSYYAGQGQMERANACRKRMEVHAVQLGSAWQVETWAPADAIKLALRTQDAAVMKRAVQELARLSESVTSLSIQERNARVGYLMLRGKHAQAIQLAESSPPIVAHSVIGWARSQGVLARAYNALGKHEQARNICLEVLAGYEPEDLDHVVMNLNVSIELAMAEAGLGRLQLATQQLEELYARHEPNHSPLTLSSLHDALARVALLGRDYERARSEQQRAHALIKPLNIASLNERSRTLARLVERNENPVGLESGGVHFDNVNHLMTRVQLMLSQQGHTEIGDRATRCLQVALELSSADDGFVVLAGSAGEPAAYLGSDIPEAELVTWAEQSLLDADVDEQTVMTEEVDSQIDSNYKVSGSKRYCVAPLWARQHGQDVVIAALVLGFDNRVPRMPEPAVLRAIAGHLVAS